MLCSREEGLVLIIDEFQDFEYVDKTIFQDIQNVWDRYKGESRISLVVCGSAHSMMVSIFENDKEPLFGRPTDKIVLNPLPIKVMEKVLEDHDGSYTSQDLLMFYMLTGGVPKYMEVLVDSGAFDSESMLERATSAGSVFLTDGKDLLVTEFGKEYRTYASILQLLSSGKEKRSEIEDVLQTEAGAYLKRMEDELGLVRHVSPVFSEPSSRNIKWKMSDPYLKFYFRFIRPSTGYVESGRYDLLLRSIKAGLPDYEGRALEDFFSR
jgi:AAA+ ATPase superfamily predicted ATPase